MRTASTRRLLVPLLVVVAVAVWIGVDRAGRARMAEYAGVYVQDPDAPETRLARAQAMRDAPLHPRAATFESLAAAGMLRAGDPVPLQLLVLLENGEAGVRPVPPNPSLAATGRWEVRDGGIVVTLTHYVQQEMPEPHVLEGGRVDGRLRLHGAEQAWVFEQVQEGSDCVCAAGRAGETVWCLPHDRGFVGGHETPCWRCSYAAHRHEPCPACAEHFRAEGGTALLRGERARAEVLLARAYTRGHADPNLPYLLARARSAEEPRTWRHVPGSDGMWPLPAPRGDLLVEATEDGRHRVRDLLTGAELRVLPEPAERIVLDPAGRFVLAVHEATARVWAVRGGQADADLVGHEVQIVHVDVSRSGRRIATIDKVGTVRVWSPAGDLRMELRPTEEAGGALRATLDPTGDRVAVNRADGRLVLLAMDGTRLTPSVHVGTFLDARLPDGEGPAVLSSSLRDNALWDLEEGACFAVLGAEHLDTSPGREAAHLPSSPFVVDVDVQGTSLYDPHDAMRRHVAQGPDERNGLYPIAELAGQGLSLEGDFATRDGHRFATSGPDGRVHVWGAAPLALLASYETTGARALFACFSRDGERLVAGTPDGTVFVWPADRDGRSPDEIEADVAARSRWRIEGRTLVEAGGEDD